MKIDYDDATGRPRSDADIINAHRVVSECLIGMKLMMAFPELFVELTTIRDALEELLIRRKEAGP